MFASYGILELRVRLVPLNMFKPFSIFLLTVTRGRFFCGSVFVIYVSRLSLYANLSVPCRNGITCWERADLSAHLCVLFSCVFVTFPHVVSGQVWNLIVLIPDLCLQDKIAFAMVMIAAYGILQHLS